MRGPIVAGIVAPVMLVSACGCHLPRGGAQLQPPVAHVPPLADEACHAGSVQALMRCVDSARIGGDLRRLAVPRPSGSPGHRAARAACRERFAALGYEVKEAAYDGGINVIGTKPGVTEPDAQVIVSAHYDGVAGCAGADDNASGVAVLFEVARVLSAGRFSRSLVVACWDGGEQGQTGSAAYAAKKTAVKGMIALESVAYRDDTPRSQSIPEGFERVFPDQALRLLEHDDRGDFATIVSDTRSEDWAEAMGSIEIGARVELLVLTEAVKVKLKKLHRSDHVSFWSAGAPAVLLTDTGPFRNPHHHCKGGADTPERLDVQLAAGFAQLAVAGAVDKLELRSPTQGFVQ